MVLAFVGHVPLPLTFGSLGCWTSNLTPVVLNRDRTYSIPGVFFSVMSISFENPLSIDMEVSWNKGTPSFHPSSSDKNYPLAIDYSRGPLVRPRLWLGRPSQMDQSVDLKIKGGKWMIVQCGAPQWCERWFLYSIKTSSLLAYHKP